MAAKMCILVYSKNEMYLILFREAWDCLNLLELLLAIFGMSISTDQFINSKIFQETKLP